MTNSLICFNTGANEAMQSCSKLVFALPCRPVMQTWVNNLTKNWYLTITCRLNYNSSRDRWHKIWVITHLMTRLEHEPSTLWLSSTQLGTQPCLTWLVDESGVGILTRQSLLSWQLFQLICTSQIDQLVNFWGRLRAIMKASRNWVFLFASKVNDIDTSTVWYNLMYYL